MFAIHSASKFGRYSFNSDIEKAFRRIHTIPSGLKHFINFSSNFSTKIRPSFFLFGGRGGVNWPILIKEITA